VTTVVINDFVTDRRVVLLFNYPQDFAKIEAHWEREDKLLLALSANEAFRDRKRWCDLSPTHFRFLIMNTLNKVSALSEQEQGDADHLVMVSLAFLLSAFIKCLEDCTESNIDLMRINRLGDDEVLYDYAASINMHLDNLRPKKNLRVIVDNT
jgi:hypothetical protein